MEINCKSLIFQLRTQGFAFVEVTENTDKKQKSISKTIICKMCYLTNRRTATEKQIGEIQNEYIDNIGR